MDRLLTALLVSLLLTLLLECAFAFVAGARTPRRLLLVALVNVLTNPPVVLLCTLFPSPLLTAANQEDDATRLLAALRPLLGEARRKKLDEASRILKLLHLLPLLRESGILQNIF